MIAHAMLTRLPIGNLAVAKALASEGFHVFPCQAEGETAKRPCRGVSWRQVSTTDPRRLDSWWRQWPDALPGIDLAKSGLLVIDADRHGGPDGVTAWAELVGDKGDHWPVVTTPSGGSHTYFRQPDGEVLTNSRGTLPAGIDVRGSGGYVIAPGSRLPDGRTYELSGDLNGADVAPEWLVKILRGQAGDDVERITTVLPAPRKTLPLVRSSPSQHYLDTAVNAELDRVRTAGPGQWNEILNKAAFALGTMVGAGWLKRSDAHAWLLEASLAARPRKRSEGMNSIRSGLDAGIKHPRPPVENETDAFAELGREIALAIGQAEPLIKQPDEPVTQACVEHSEPQDFPEALTYPGGLVQEVADWIEATARYPSRPMALAAALSVMGTAMGREWAGPTDSSTTLYTLILAPTGAGKDHPLEQAARLLDAAGGEDLIGPDDFQSSNAMANMVQRKPLSLCVMDEFGAFLGRITHRNASSFSRDTSALMRKMWSIKFKRWRSSEYAQRSSVAVWAPALNILGVSVPKEFYAALRGVDVSNGLFNRFFVVSATTKPSERNPLLPPSQVPEDLKRKLAYALSRGRLHDSKRNGEIEVFPSFVIWGEGGEAADLALKEEIDLRIEADEDARDFYTRTREMAIRIATIVGFGKGSAHPRVDGETMQWAGRVALWSTEQMYQQYREYAAENETQALAKEILRHVRAACPRKNDVIPHSVLLKKLDHRFRANDVKGVIEMLVMAGDLKMMQGEKSANGKTPIGYQKGQS